MNLVNNKIYAWFSRFALQMPHAQFSYKTWIKQKLFIYFLNRNTSSVPRMCSHEQNFNLLNKKKCLVAVV